jgi:transcriptional regulator with XRE-family HTH domain
MQDPPWINLPGRKALVKWRETNQYLCRDVAAKLGLAPETYSKIERGKRRMPEYLRPKAAKVTGGEVPVDAWVWKTERKG